MKSRLISILGLGLVCVFAQTQAKADNFGMAGCGVGSLIFKDQPGKIQILASITNWYFVQTSSVSSGTSGCWEEGPREQASLFITINEKALKKDISRGEGETLAGLSDILQCSNTQRLADTLQKNYEAIFPADDKGAAHVVDTIGSSIRSDEELASACKVVI